ncbi:tapasin-related protein-like [Erpetoichthys calabaricus]|uniref:Tapasin-related protein-like n=1 Tax=Erpetoichthys calabaricus TaxID=27687 RepID=A0A8C4SAJ1_ERPCA|nr:tapasin-related protein-like [Erpetoichthys calabaricus]XP_028662532.1 tapasin-related protein-like [Erpetoichthys calabaricus]XP_051786927.1 tapasin-related protein-like [Erpetoichthys calabaricus]
MSTLRIPLLCPWLLLAGVIWHSEFSTSATLKEIHKVHCTLIEEHTYSGEKGLEIEYLRRNAMLLLKSPLTEEDWRRHMRETEAANIISFVVKDAAVDISQHADDDIDNLLCEIKRYSTAGIQVHWPGSATTNDNVDSWFSCTIKHKDDKFIVTSFLKQLPSPLDQSEEDTAKVQDYNSVKPIRDHDTLVLAAVFIVYTRTPTIQQSLTRDATLDCGFEVDHSPADVMVEWRFQHKGERKKLFSYSTRTGMAETLAKGVSVSVKKIPKGVASLHLSSISIGNEGAYVCSVYVPPLYGSHDLQLEVIESPMVTIHSSKELVLQEGDIEKLVCEINGYYPLDVEVEWLREVPGKHLLPFVVKNILFTSHRHYNNGTFGISAFFLLHASLIDDGVVYTCRVSHKSLRVPIRKKITVHVKALPSYFMVYVVIVLIILVSLLIYLLRTINKAKEAQKRKPY